MQDLLPIAPDVIICIPTIKRDIDSKMLTKTAPMNGDAIIMTDRATEIAPATILISLMLCYLTCRSPLNNSRYTIKKQNVCEEYQQDSMPQKTPCKNCQI